MKRTATGGQPVTGEGLLLDFSYRAGSRIQRHWVQIRAHHAGRRYRPIAGELWISRDREEALYYAWRAKSLVAFMDAVDVKKSMSRGGIYRMALRAARRAGFHARSGFDHTSVWFRESGYLRGSWQDCQYVITTEPYDDTSDVEDFCAAIGWPAYVCRPGIGLWNPAGGTRLILVSPPKIGLPLNEIGPLVNAALPEIVKHESKGKSVTH